MKKKNIILLLLQIDSCHEISTISTLQLCITWFVYCKVNTDNILCYYLIKLTLNNLCMYISCVHKFWDKVRVNEEKKNCGTILEETRN